MVASSAFSVVAHSGWAKRRLPAQVLAGEGQELPLSQAGQRAEAESWFRRQQLAFCRIPLSCCVEVCCAIMAKNLST